MKQPVDIRTFAVEQSVMFHRTRMQMEHATWASPSDVLATAREFTKYIMDEDWNAQD